MLLIVMAGLVPAIHVFTGRKKDVDARQRRQVYVVCAKQTTMAGHDELIGMPRAAAHMVK
jgi:hypothetical protein